MLLNLTGHPIVIGDRVFDPTFPTPYVVFRAKAKLKMADILRYSDSGLDPDIMDGILDPDFPVEEAPEISGIRFFPDLEPEVRSVLVTTDVARAMERARLQVREGVLVLSPTLQSRILVRDMEGLPSIDGLTTTVSLHVYPHLTGTHQDPGLQRNRRP